MSNPEKEPNLFEFTGEAPENPVSEILHVGENFLHRTEAYFAETTAESKALAKALAKGVPQYSKESVDEIRRILGKTIDKEW